MRRIIFGVASLLLMAGNTNAATIGYCTDKISKTYTYRMGSSMKQGQMIRLSKEKLQMLKGKSIDFAEFALASKNTCDANGKINNMMHVFITTSPEATPIAESDIKISGVWKRTKWTLDKPYTITGEEENLYIGYTANIGETYKLLMGDGSYDIEGYNFAWNDEGWKDTYGTGKGSAYVSVNVEGASDYSDVIMGRMDFNGYYKAGNNYNIAARLINAGTKAITSFDAIIDIEGKTTTQHFEGLNITKEKGYSFTLADINTDTEGDKNIKVTVSNINGNNEDIDPTDNNIAGNVFFYPENMERSLLVEGFTGQDCPNCPAGHRAINSAVESYTDNPIIEVTHHAGYYPDIFTMEDDYAYTFYYSNSTSTYAPAVMVNRTANPDISSVPVIETDYNNIVRLLNYSAKQTPYVSLNLAAALDEKSRTLNVKFQIKPHTKLPKEKMLFNVFLVQDSLRGYQSNGGDNYLHNRVFRGTVTGNSWGITVSDPKVGEVITWEKSITIPDSIHSTYWTDDLIQPDEKTGELYYSGKYLLSQCNIEAVLKNMSVVAYVGEYDPTDNAHNIVYNCVEAKLGSYHTQTGFGITTGIENTENKLEAKANVNIHINNGNVCVDGNYDKMNIYTLSGRMVDANSTLAKGIYIVKVVANGKQTTKKVMVK